MPIYEYKCSDCGRISEFLETAKGSKDRKCLHCGREKMQKQLSVFSAQVKQGQSKKCFGCTDSACPHSRH